LYLYDLHVYIYSIVMEPITLLVIYTTGLIIGSVSIGYYIENYSNVLYKKMEVYLDDNFVLHF